MNPTRLLLAATLLACNTTSARPQAADDAPPRATSAAATTATDAAPPTTAVRFVAAADDTDAISLIRTKRLEAKAEGRVLVVYVGAGWCPPCRAMKDEIHSGRLDARLARTTFLAFDADRDGDRLASAGYTFKFIPYVALPGADGHPAESAEARGKGGGAWRDLLPTIEGWQSSPTPAPTH